MFSWKYPLHLSRQDLQPLTPLQFFAPDRNLLNYARRNPVTQAATWL
ncbi:MAG: hypothetical protein KME59_22060 [Trichormus sp. ATA11-4-KO1]|nr:hypothetical protein [Trichormus sp. ATA11-4-KO1]